MTTTRTFPAYDLKPGDMINGREVFDTFPTLDHRFAIVFTDDTRLIVAHDEIAVAVD